MRETFSPTIRAELWEVWIFYSRGVDARSTRLRTLQSGSEEARSQAFLVDPFAGVEIADQPDELPFAGELQAWYGSEVPIA